MESLTTRISGGNSHLSGARLSGRNFEPADSGKDYAREIREYFIPDFSNWKDHDSYRVAFKRLLGDLKAEDSAASA